MREYLSVINCSKSKTGVEQDFRERLDEVPNDVRKKLVEIWRWALQGTSQGDGGNFGTFEKELREKMLELGGAILEEAAPCRYGTGYEGSRPQCPECGKISKFMNYRLKRITTLVKQVSLKRAYYYCRNCGQGWLPLDGVLGIESTTLSPAVREAICLVDAEVPFERGQRWLKELSGISVAEEEGRLVSEGLGKELEEQTQEEIANVWEIHKPTPREISSPPQRLYISPDGTTIHTGEGWKEVKVGAVFTTRIPIAGQDPIREVTRYVGTLENAEAFGKRLYVEALKLGLEECPEVIVVADGAHWIWNEAELWLPKERVEIIDFYHATEKLWTVGKTVFGEENPKTKQWVEARIQQLEKGRIASLLQALRRLPVRGKEAKNCLRQTLGYFQRNHNRMRYDEFKKKGYFIGSGVVESSCKHLIASRLKQAGMRWNKKGAQPILQLRLSLLNQRWDHLWLPMAA